MFENAIFTVWYKCRDLIKYQNGPWLSDVQKIWNVLNDDSDVIASISYTICAIS